MWKLMIVLCVAFSANLSAEIKVLALAGSTRDDSINKKLIVDAANIARQMQATVTVIDLKDYQMALHPGNNQLHRAVPDILHSRQNQRVVPKSDKAHYQNHALMFRIQINNLDSFPCIAMFNTLRKILRIGKRTQGY